MRKKVLFLDSISIDSNIQVGSYKYAKLFCQKNYEVVSLANFLNINRFFRRNSEDRELIQNWKRNLQINKDGILFYTPFCYLPYLNFPFFDSLWFAHNCLRFTIPELKKILKKIYFVNVDILFIQNIRLISVLRFIRPKLIVYRISDRVEGFLNVPSTILSLHQEVMRISNIIFITSFKLYKESKQINSNCFYLPNGVDKDFIPKENDFFILPLEYQNIKKPIAIYIGTISDWFDYELYEYGLAKLKNTTFIMIGSISGVNYRKNLAKIQRYSKLYQNFHYLGPKPHSELKRYLAHADMGIIPFTVNPLTNEINPIKLFEYASFGLPVLAPHLSELQNYEENVLFYKNKEEYVNLISGYSGTKAYLAQKLIEFARRNTWEKRFTFMLSRIGELKR